jgi:hypothetical protein
MKALLPGGDALVFGAKAFALASPLETAGHFITGKGLNQ